MVGIFIMRTEKQEKEYQRKKAWTLANIDKTREQKRTWYIKHHPPKPPKNDDNGVTKTCIKCKENKLILDFTKNKKCKNGITGTCKRCEAKYSLALFRKTHPYYIKKERDLEKLKQYQKEYRKNNKNKIKAKARERERIRRKTDPLFKLSCSLKHRMRSHLKASGLIKTDKSAKLLGATIDIVKKHIERQFTRGMSWSNHGIDGWHIDHIIPLSSAKNEEDLLALFHYTNLQPLWAKDNFKKNDNIIEGKNQLKLTI